jgi:muramoyltetrapeptide carboxypeptidase LdcA involved in peptidoglycan recycling
MAGEVEAGEFRYPDKPRRGDAVAVLSPSSGLAAPFPRPFELGLARLREEFGLLPVEFPTTRAAAASPAERAADLMTAFADPQIKAVIASIGGEDELKVLAHLDPEVLAASPKPFFGYSDNTNLHLFLWNLGLVSYLGGSVMVQFGWPVAMEPTSRLSLQRALLQRGSYRLEPPDRYTDEEGNWDDPAMLGTEPLSFPATPWSWHGPRVTVTGPAWGGNLEIVDFHLRTGRYLAPDDAYDAVLAAVSEYHPGAPLVFGVDFGHTEPQHVIPSGGAVTVDGEKQEIRVSY